MSQSCCIYDARTKVAWVIKGMPPGHYELPGDAPPDTPDGFYRALPLNGAHGVSALLAIRNGRILEAFRVPTQNVELWQRSLEERYGLRVWTVGESQVFTVPRGVTLETEEGEGGAKKVTLDFPGRSILRENTEGTPDAAVLPDDAAGVYGEEALPPEDPEPAE